MADKEARDVRKAELAANLAAVRRRIDDACAAARRDPNEVTLIAVTKTFPASDVALLAELGLHEMGENRDQDASRKAAELAEAGVERLRWHFLGRLQRNKCRSVASYAGLVHSVDRADLLPELAKGVRLAKRPKPLEVLMQICLDSPSYEIPEDPTRRRGGVFGAEAMTLAAEIARYDELKLSGVMGIAPLNSPPEPAFAQLEAVSRHIRTCFRDATIISAGMSADLAAAVAAGATHVRVGTALLGIR